ncbi:hypothetical protein CCP3SC15_610002 [Gammaproteobacteria bacterium]
MKILGFEITPPWQKRSLESQVAWLPSNLSASGIDVTPDSAMRSVAVYSCVRLIANTIGTLPLFCYKRLAQGKERDAKHPLYRLVHDMPNSWQTHSEFFSMMTGHVLLRGNAYAYKEFNGGGIEELRPLHPDKVRPYWRNGTEIRYEIEDATGKRVDLDRERILHIRGLSTDGLMGLSPISQLREAIGLSMAAEDYGARLFGNGARPGGILTHPGKMNEDSAKRLKKDWQEYHGGSKNAHRVAVLEEGMKWEALGLSSVDAQFLETRQFQRTEIAAIYAVPPHMIGDLTHATFSNIEHQYIEYNVNTLRPWLVAWEQALMRDLFSDVDKETHMIEFLVDGLLRGDAKTRSEALAIQRQNGIINADEWRAIENMNPLPDGQGEIYLLPLNMTTPKGMEKQEEAPVEKAPKAEPDKAPADEPAADDNSDEGRSVEKYKTAFRRIFLEALNRIVTKEVKAGRSTLKSSDGKSMVDSFWGDYSKHVSEVLREAVRSYLHILNFESSLGAVLDDFSNGYVRRSVTDYAAGGGVSLLDSWQGSKAAAEVEYLFEVIDREMNHA